MNEVILKDKDSARSGIAIHKSQDASHLRQVSPLWLCLLLFISSARNLILHGVW